MASSTVDPFYISMMTILNYFGRFFLTDQVETYQQGDLCLIGESFHGSNTTQDSGDSGTKSTSNKLLLSGSRASTPSLSLTRASPDHHWRLRMFLHFANETSIRVPPFRIATSTLTGIEAVLEDQISEEGVIRLGQVWSMMDERQKYRVVVQTREMFKALRTTKPRDIPQRPVIADRYVSRPGCNPANRIRVYKDNKEFVRILRDSVASVSYDSDLVRSAVEFVDELASSRNELVFTHGNLTADNIYISERTGDVLAIGNWSEAGYYPLYWEFVKAKLSYNNEPDFDRDGAVEEILEPWRIELALMKPAHEVLY